MTSEQIQLLTDSVLTECSFADIKPDETDFYHTEMYSCRFKRVIFHKAQFIKSEINDTEFTDTCFISVSFSNAEIFDCVFLRCAFDDSYFLSTGIWNTAFKECTFTNIDFESAYIENVVFINPTFIKPVNLNKATKITINIGTAENPILLCHEESVKWITEHSSYK